MKSTRPHFRHWTPAEESILRERLALDGIPQLAIRLGRTIGSIKFKAESLGLPAVWKPRPGHCLDCRQPLSRRGPVNERCPRCYHRCVIAAPSPGKIVASRPVVPFSDAHFEALARRAKLGLPLFERDGA